MFIVTQILKFIKSNKEFIGVVAISLVIMSALQLTHLGKLADPDGFYHAKVSKLLQQGKLHDSFPYLIYTTWRDGFADQHFLYHALLIPFNNIDHIYLSIILFTTLAVACFYLLLKKLGAHRNLLWVAILLLGSTDFLFRVNLVKANTLSLSLLCLLMFALWFWHGKKSWMSVVASGVISFLFVWTYGGFVFVPVVVGLYGISVLISERRFIVAPCLAAAVGIIFGLVLHPHHGNLLMSLYNQIFLTGLGAGSVVPAGNEWLPYNLDWFLKTDLIALFVWLVGLLVFVKQVYKRTITAKELWLHSFAIVILILTLKHRRFIEYFIPFAVLAAAVTLSPYIVKIKWQEFKQSLKHWQFLVATGVLGAAIFLSFVYNFSNVYGYLDGGELTHQYEAVSKNTAQISKEGEIIINTQWDEFPQLFYWNSVNYYPVGMDPTFMYIYDPDLYWKWRTIADQDESQWTSSKQVRDIIVESLKAQFLFIDSNRNPDLPKFIQKNGPSAEYFETVYNEDSVYMYRVK